MIGIINLKFFSWKKKQEGDLNLRNAFFYTIAKNAAIDQISTDDNELHDEHQDLIQNVFFGDDLNNVEKKYLVDQILMKVSSSEKDALVSVVNKESINEYKTRNNIEKTNSAIKRRRRAVEAAANRINSLENYGRVENGI